MICLLHFNLKNPIMVGKKKTQVSRRRLTLPATGKLRHIYLFPAWPCLTWLVKLSWIAR